MRIQVTQEDINNGRRANTISCPVALAIDRAIKLDFLAVGSRLVTYRRPIKKKFLFWKVKGSSDFKSYTLPAYVRQNISDFDVGEVIYPFEFELPI